MSTVDDGSDDLKFDPEEQVVSGSAEKVGGLLKRMLAAATAPGANDEDEEEQAPRAIKAKNTHSESQKEKQLKKRAKAAPPEESKKKKKKSTPKFTVPGLYAPFKFLSETLRLGPIIRQRNPLLDSFLLPYAAAMSTSPDTGAPFLFLLLLIFLLDRYHPRSAIYLTLLCLSTFLYASTRLLTSSYESIFRADRRIAALHSRLAALAAPDRGAQEKAYAHLLEPVKVRHKEALRRAQGLLGVFVALNGAWVYSAYVYDLRRYAFCWVLLFVPIVLTMVWWVPPAEGEGEGNGEWRSIVGVLVKVLGLDVVFNPKKQVVPEFESGFLNDLVKGVKEWFPMWYSGLYLLSRVTYLDILVVAPSLLIGIGTLFFSGLRLEHLIYLLVWSSAILSSLSYTSFVRIRSEKPLLNLICFWALMLVLSMLELVPTVYFFLLEYVPYYLIGKAAGMAVLLGWYGVESDAAVGVFGRERDGKGLAHRVFLAINKRYQKKSVRFGGEEADTKKVVVVPELSEARGAGAGVAKKARVEEGGKKGRKVAMNDKVEYI